MNIQNESGKQCSPTAIVTGASGGIGAAVAEKLAKEGYSLVLLGNQGRQKLEALAEKCSDYGISVLPLAGDLSYGDTAGQLMAQAVSHLGTVDLLVNCAGISWIGLLTDMTEEDWHKVINTNLSSVFYCCRFVIPFMVREKAGRILTISSVWGSQGASCEAAYSASKGGIHALTKALAKELAPSGIAVNALACGMIDTPMNHCFSPEEVDAICREIPAGRMGTPEEAADMIALLAKAPVYFTGQIVTMDGGWW
ncbi:MAG: SDR family NAD(P)-dependent oxidoreductase [Lachnospiraceae bacterium]|nr:SDR family NAD(P)-dependent oxidoreductase [Lachnospiraceae bacterium]